MTEPSKPPTETGDQICDECGAVNPVWFVQNKLWNGVIPNRVGVLCPSCFIKKAETAGIECTGWELVPGNLLTWTPEELANFGKLASAEQPAPSEHLIRAVSAESGEPPELEKFAQGMSNTILHTPFLLQNPEQLRKFCRAELADYAVACVSRALAQQEKVLEAWREARAFECNRADEAESRIAELERELAETRRILVSKSPKKRWAALKEKQSGD